MFRYGLALVVLTFVLPSTAFAYIERCEALVNGVETVVFYDTEGSANQSVSTGESVLRSPGVAWDWAWGEVATCNSQVLIEFLSSELPSEDVDGYCLNETDDGWLLVPGSQNFRGRCIGMVCETVNATADEIAAVGAAITAAAGGATTATTTAGVAVVSHSSGALILTGNAGYIAGTLGTAGTAILSVLTAPITIAGAAVVTVTASGALYVCSG